MMTERRRFYLECEEWVPRRGWEHTVVSEYARTADEALAQLLARAVPVRHIQVAEHP